MIAKKAYKKSKIAWVQRANISAFLEGCRKLGIRDIDIFGINDLFEQKRLSSVIKTIYAISAKAKEVKDYDGPTIGF